MLTTRAFALVVAFTLAACGSAVTPSPTAPAGTPRPTPTAVPGDPGTGGGGTVPGGMKARERLT